MNPQLLLTLPPERWSEAGPWYRYFAALVVALEPVNATLTPSEANRFYRALRGHRACRERWFGRMGHAGAWYVPGGDVLAHCRAVVEATE